MLSSCCCYSLNAIDSLRSEDCSTVQICIVEIFLERCVESLKCSLIPPRRKPYIKLYKPQLLNLLGHGSPQVKVGHWRRTLWSRRCM